MLASLSTALTSLALSAAAPVAGDAVTPTWHNDYGKALAETREDDRPLLVVIEAPAGGGEADKSEAWDAVKPELLGAYDLCRVNAGTKYGKAVAEAFDTSKFPYVAIIDKTGKTVLHSQSGEMTSDKLAETLTRFRSGEQPVRVTVAKPVVESGVYLEGVPAQATPAYYQPTRSYYAPVSDCPNCRRGY